MIRRRYNWLADLPDQRDYLFSERLAAPKRLPSRVDLRKGCSPVFDQGRIGSCTGNALAGAIEYLELRDLASGSGAKDPQIFAKGEFTPLSRLFIYYNERALRGTVMQDSGATLRDGVKTLVTWGICRESLWGYDPVLLYRKPLARAYAEAKSHRISGYFRMESLRELKQCLADGYPFAFGFTVYESFESTAVARTGVAPLPTPAERALGGHAVLAVGYDDASHCLLVRNSWGARWGQRGYFTLPYAFVEFGLARDFWTIRG